MNDVATTPIEDLAKLAENQRRILLRAESKAAPGFMVIDGALREVFFPMLGRARVLARRHYCLDEAEAVAEAETFRHQLAALAGAPVAAPPAAAKPRKKGRAHWTGQLSADTLELVRNATGEDPTALPLRLAHEIMQKPDVRRMLVRTLALQHVQELRQVVGLDFSPFSPAARKAIVTGG
jgi:hypothetical protein